jgi:hypothetical protein
MDARGQASHVLIDARNQEGITEEIAERGIRRAYGADSNTGRSQKSMDRGDTEKGSIQSIRIIGKDFDITVLRRGP